MLSYMRHTVVCLILLAACDSDSTEPDLIEPDFVTPARVNGTWWLTFIETCGAPSPPLIQLTVQFRDDGQTGSVGSFWVADDSSLEGPANGQIRFSDGHVDMQLWGLVNQFVVNQSALLLSGTMTAHEQFSGAARDPAPGFGSVLPAGTCNYVVSGRRVIDSRPDR
jgi:hypothetical protein